MLDIASSPYDRAEDVHDLLSETVDRTIREHLGSEKIVSVRSRHSEDFDGEEIISIDVVINAPTSRFDSKRLSSLARMLRSSLAEIGISAFPMVNYMTEAEKAARRR